MRIAVCIKRTPDSESRFKIAASSTSIDETGLKFDMDDFASYAVEVALQLNEKQPPGEVVVIAVGPDTVQETLRKAMSMGADRAIQLKTDAVPVDGLAIAKALAAEIKAGGFDLVLFGKLSFDTSASVVGTATAELDWVLVRGFHARSFLTDDRRIDGVLPSDHFPLVVELDWPKH